MRLREVRRYAISPKRYGWNIRGSQQLLPASTCLSDNETNHSMSTLTFQPQLNKIRMREQRRRVPAHAAEVRKYLSDGHFRPSEQQADRFARYGFLLVFYSDHSLSR